MASTGEQGTFPDPNEEGEQPLSNDKDDEVALSPASKKVLEICSMAVPSGSANNEARPLLSRPTTDEVNVAGFQFSKPAYPLPKLTSSAQPSRRDVGMSKASRQCDYDAEQDSTLPSGQRIMNDIRSQDCPTSSFPRNPEQIPGNSSSNVVGKNLEKTQKAIVNAQPEQSDRQNVCFAASNPLHANVVLSHPSSMEDTRQCPRESDVGQGTSPDSPNVQPRHTPSPSHRMEGTGDESKTPQRSTSQSSKRQASPPSQISRSQASRVTKLRDMKNSSVSGAAMNTTGGMPLPSQPSEEDLFYMLINKMKRRDEAAATETALKQKLHAKLRKADDDNKVLTAQLKQAMGRSDKYETELTSQRAMIEKWKVKFSKLRDVVRSIGDDQESLRNDGRRMMAAQESLKGDKTQIFEQLNDVKETAEMMREKSTQQKHCISDIQQGLRALEKSAALAEAKTQEKERALTAEKARVAKLDGYIKSSSNRQLKQAQDIRQAQLEALSKIGDMSERIDHYAKDSQSVLKAEFAHILSPLADISAAVKKWQSLDPAELEKPDTSIVELKHKWDAHHDTISKLLEHALREQDNRGAEVVRRLQDIDATFSAASKTAEQLAQAKELNGKLQEKLNGVEFALEQSNEDRRKLESNEEHLKIQIDSLETETAALQKKLDARSRDGAKAASEMQTRFEATSSALADATESLMAKEKEMQHLMSELEEMKSSLGSSEALVATLEAEKLQIEEDASNTEQRVRTELARASLKSKEQSRALYEQEQHKLKQEKESAEKDVQRLKVQLEATKCSLTEANQLHAQVATEVTECRKEIEELKVELSRKTEETSNGHDNLQGQLDAAHKQNEQLKSEMVKLQENEVSAMQMDLLQERFDILQQECTEKDQSIAVLNSELEKRRNEHAKQISELEKTLFDKNREVDGLTKQLDDVQQTRKDAQNQLECREKDIVSLTEQLQSLERQRPETSGLRDTVQNQKDEIQKLQSRVHDSDFWAAKVERLLQNLGLIGPQNSLSSCWDQFESRLTCLVDQAGHIQTPRAKVDSRLDARNNPKREFSQNEAILSKSQERLATPQVEYQTTEVVYRQRSVRESQSATPAKGRRKDAHSLPKEQCNAGNETSIKPFSQVQQDGNIEGQSSPLSQLTDLSSFFRGSPNAKHSNNGTQPRQIADTEKLGPRHSQAQGGTPQLAAGAGSGCNNDAEHRLPQEKKTTNLSDTRFSPKDNKAKHEGLGKHPASTGHASNVASCGRSTTSIAVSETGSQDGSKSRGCKVPPKGILKDTRTYLSRQRSLTNTPMKGQKAGRATVRRRQTRTSSAYFEDGPVCSSAARPGGSAGVKRGSQVVEDPEDVSAPPSRPKTRRRTKGDRYNDRFSRIS